MQVRVGWSGEIGNNVWRKADVELDEIDLYRMLSEAEVVSGDGESDTRVMNQISTKVAFQLLQAEAETVLLSKLVSMGYEVTKANERIAKFQAQNEHVLAALRNKYSEVLTA